MKFSISILNVFCLIIFSACTHHPTTKVTAVGQPKAEFRTPSSALPKDQVIDLTDVQAKAHFIQILEREFSGKSNLDFDTLVNLLASQETYESTTQVTSKYIEMAFQTFGSNSHEAWDAIEDEQIKPSCIFTIYRYIDPQTDDDLPGGKGIWEVVNKKMRKGENLSSHEAKFVDSMKCAIQSLPSVKAMIFRGESLSKEELADMEKKVFIPFPSFTSTSVSVGKALDFARFNQVRESGRMPTLLIIQSDQGLGAPISAYLPENVHEYEVLIPPQTRFQFVKKVVNPTNGNLIVFLKRLPN